MLCNCNALKNLAVKLGCTESVNDIHADTISGVIQFMDENAPFGVEKLFSWDGNIEGRETVVDDTGDTPFIYYKITDEVFELSDFIGAIMSVSGVTENNLPLPTESVITEENIDFIIDGVLAVGWSFPLIISVNRIIAPFVVDNSWLDSASNGTYVLLAYLGDPVTIPPIFCRELTRVKTLDSKVIPKDFVKADDIVRNVVIGGFVDEYECNMDFETAQKNLDNGAMILFRNASKGFTSPVPKFERTTDFIRLYLPTGGDITNTAMYLFKSDGSIIIEGGPS